MSSAAGLRVLIVEDEALVAMMVEDLLLDLGHTVAGTAARLDDGLVKAQALAFDVAILDINLQGEHSTVLAEALARRGIPVIVMTGYRAALPSALAAIPVLRKPFRQVDVEAALARAMTSTGGQPLREGEPS